MGVEKVRKFLQKSGFRKDPHCNTELFYLKTEILPVCECTGHSPKLFVKIYPELKSEGTFIPVSITVEFCGELCGIWFKPLVYSLSVDEFLERYDSIRLALESSWIAFADSF